MRRRVGAVTVVAVAVAAVVALSGCTSSSRPGTALPPSAAPSRSLSPATPADASRLVGVWRVTATGAEAGTVLVIGNKADGGVVVFARCGQIEGQWRANDAGLFIADLNGGDEACMTGAANDPTPSWLRDAVGFRLDGRGIDLLDGGGTTIARLTPGAQPTVGPNATSDFGVALLTPAMRAGFAVPAPLPAGVTPATMPGILGRWVPLDHRPTRAYVAFGADHSYVGSDGCNGAGGRYVLGSDGVILATAGPTTLIGCNNSPLASWVAVAGRVGLRAGRLVFVDPRGHVLGEARRP